MLHILLLLGLFLVAVDSSECSWSYYNLSLLDYGSPWMYTDNQTEMTYYMGVCSPLNMTAQLPANSNVLIYQYSPASGNTTILARYDPAHSWTAFISGVRWDFSNGDPCPSDPGQPINTRVNYECTSSAYPMGITAVMMTDACSYTIVFDAASDACANSSGTQQLYMSIAYGTIFAVLGFSVLRLSFSLISKNLLAMNTKAQIPCVILFFFALFRMGSNSFGVFKTSSGDCATGRAGTLAMIFSIVGFVLANYYFVTLSHFVYSHFRAHMIVPLRQSKKQPKYNNNSSWIIVHIFMIPASVMPFIGTLLLKDSNWQFAFLGWALAFALIGVSAAFLLTYESWHQATDTVEWKQLIQFVYIFAWLGTLERIFVDAFELFYTTPKSAVCDTSGMATFVETGFHGLVECLLIVVSGVLFWSDWIDSFQPQRSWLLNVFSSRNYFLILPTLFSFFVFAVLMGDTVQVVSNLVPSNPFLQNSQTVFRAFMTARLSKTACTYFTVATALMIHRPLAHLMFASLFGSIYQAPHIRLNLHKWLGWGVLLCALSHVISHTVSATLLWGSDPDTLPGGTSGSVYNGPLNLHFSYPGITGWIMLVSLATVIISGHTVLAGRCGLSFQNFYFLHYSGAFLFVLMFSTHGLGKFFGVPPSNGIAVFVVSAITVATVAIFRVWMPPRQTSVVKVKILEGPHKRLGQVVLLLEVRRPDEWITRGQEIPARIVSIGLLGEDDTQEHPFSICSASKNGHLQFHINVTKPTEEEGKGKWTFRLLQKAEQKLGVYPIADKSDLERTLVVKQAFGLALRGPIAGPLSGALQTLRHRQVLMLYSANTGCAPMLSILAYVLYALNRDDLALQHIRFIHLNEETDYAKAVRREFKRLYKKWWLTRRPGCEVTVKFRQLVTAAKARATGAQRRAAEVIPIPSGDWQEEVDDYWARREAINYDKPLPIDRDRKTGGFLTRDMKTNGYESDPESDDEDEKVDFEESERAPPGTVVPRRFYMFGDPGMFADMATPDTSDSQLVRPILLLYCGRLIQSIHLKDWKLKLENSCDYGEETFDL